MQRKTESAELMNLLCDAVARELQVSVQYMMQHAIGAGRMSAGNGSPATGEQEKFIASHTLYFMPGDRLKKIAITEMRHAEAISERVVLLGANRPLNRQPSLSAAPRGRCWPTTRSRSAVLSSCIRGLSPWPTAYRIV